MRQDLERLLRDSTLVTLACAIALGWSLFQVAEGLATLIAVALNSYDDPFNNPYATLTWVWGEHVFTFQLLVQGLIEFAVVLAVVLLVQRRSRPS